MADGVCMLARILSHQPNIRPRARRKAPCRRRKRKKLTQISLPRLPRPNSRLSILCPGPCEVGRFKVLQVATEKRILTPSLVVTQRQALKTFNPQVVPPPPFWFLSFILVLHLYVLLLFVQVSSSDFAVATMKVFSPTGAVVAWCLFHLQFVVSLSNVTFYSDDLCSQFLSLKTGPDDGTCTPFPSNAAGFRSFRVTSLDQTCAGKYAGATVLRD